MSPRDPVSETASPPTPTDAPVTASGPAPTATIIAFPKPVARPRTARRQPSELAATLQRAATALDAALRRLDRYGQDLAASRGDFDQAQRQLTAETVRARTIADDGARIAAAIEGGDLDAMLALQGELERRKKPE